ncbi:DUF4835 family protein [Flavobacterium salilacus subsp. salilacus]|uniref:type IX secretion system protein PorD n=1 Tax=Flavobacterium TaxID=237 RepID=UPI0010751A0D|nr:MULTISPECIES: DUF4835 family protein [Flavobacterium]KAF2517508.1 DUF4835 family protein [Flavobacterium salilacus subsp. salilacus]MBE1615656.1 DUF4835 family protein [Flavobacterium sp. SaA2.13]
MYKWFATLLVLLSFSVKGQELNCTVTVNADRITDANTQIFRTLETSLNEFVNNTRWTSKNFDRGERIECSIFINISAYDSNNFSATMQVQSSRPVYNSTYPSPILNYNDKEISFRYLENENLIYNPNSYDSNLVALMAYYANIIIGMDADSFELNSGTPYYQAAQNMVSLAQGGGYKGWSQQDGNQNRFFLVNDILSNTFTPYREALYNYHRLALDIMADNPKEGKEKVAEALKILEEVNKVRPNAFLTRIFFDAKSDEIVSVFSGGPMITISGLVDRLNKISPMNSSKWSTIK